jgi:chromosome partitioning protein
MRRIAIINQKGGVGKTTTTVNLGAALARRGRRVCLIDLDPQAHATTHLGVEPDGQQPSLYHVLLGQHRIQQVRREVAEGLWLVPADLDLAAAEVELAGVVGREVILREALQNDDAAFDYLLMDCGPSLGVLTLNALAAADEVLIPLQPHFLALHGLSKLLETTALVARRIHPGLKVSGIVMCLFDTSTRLAHEVLADLQAFLERCRGQSLPWSSARVFASKIRRNIKLAECPSHGQTIFTYAPKSPGAADYAALAEEIDNGASSTPASIDSSAGATDKRWDPGATGEGSMADAVGIVFGPVRLSEAAEVVMPGGVSAERSALSAPENTVFAMEFTEQTLPSGVASFPSQSQTSPA